MKIGYSRFTLRRLFSLIVAFATLFTLINYGVSTSQAADEPTPVTPLQQAGANYNALLAKASKGGQVRVIVTLNANFRVEASLSSVERQAQRTAIQRLQATLLSRLNGLNFTLLGAYRAFPVMAFRVDQAALQALRNSPEVVSIHEDIQLQKNDLSSNLHIGVPRVLTAGYDGTGYAVAILDSGIDDSHPFFQGRIIQEACFSSTTPPDPAHNDPGTTSLCPNGQSTFYDGLVEPGQSGPGSANACANPTCEHGSHVAGTAAGKRYTGGPNYDGIAPGAKIIAIQVFSGRNGNPANPTAFFSDIIAAMEYVYNLIPAVAPTQIAALNLSLGSAFPYTSPATCDADLIFFKFYVDGLRAVNIATVIAAGNAGFIGALEVPACVSSAISVGATTDLDIVAGFSSRASFMSLYAPGVNIDSSVPFNAYANFQGTSMAAPHVTGTWAVMRQKYPTKSVSEILSVLQSTGVPITDAGITVPRIQLDAAIGLAPVPPTSITPVNLTVTNLNDSGAGSLRDTIVSAPVGAVITFQSGLMGTIPLATQIVISQDVTIRGPGARVITIDAGGHDRIFNLSSLETTAGTHYTVNISGLALTNGNPRDTATGSPGGGAIANQGNVLTVSDMHFINNTAANSLSNVGGAIDNETGILNVVRSTFTGNTTTYRAGAIANLISGFVNINNSTLVNNSAGTAGRGGAIRVAQAELKIVNSTFFANSANAGGNLSLNTGQIYLQNSISAGGVLIGTTPSSPDVHLQAGDYFSQDYNLIQTVGTTVIGGTTTHNITGVSPNLGTLANNGGQTDTLLPLAGSPVIDKIPAAGGCNSAGDLTDQRNFARPFNVLCDIGAVEVGAALRPDTVGVFSSGTFFLRNSNTAGVADITVAFGSAGDLPTAGDWNGDGVDTIGVYEPTLGVYLLRDSNTPGSPDYSLVLGNPGDTPLAGRWDSTMTHDGVGVFRPSNGLLYLKRALTTGFADYTMVLGNPGDKGIAGDWDGNGFDSIGVFRPSSGVFFLSNAMAGTTGAPAVVFSDYNFAFGSPTDLPFAGDWVGTGASRVGVFRSGFVYLRNSLTAGPADEAFVYGPTSALPIAGKWVPASQAPRVGNVIVRPAVAPAAATSAPPRKTPVPSNIDGGGHD